MNFPSATRSGHLLLLLGLLAFICPALLSAQGTSPFTMDKQYSADQIITDKDGNVITNKIFSDNGKVRSEMTAHGMDMISIVLPAEQKVYSLMPAQKMAMAIPYNPAKFKNQMATAAAFHSNFTQLGPENVDGVPCTKYKSVSPDQKVVFLWADPVRKVPVKMMAQDGSFTVLWKNYVAAPQPATLFQIPADYQLITMPTAPNPSTGVPSQ